MVQFSVDDLKTPEKLELVLRQFQTQISDVAASIKPLPTTQSLVATLSPLIRNELQATGSAPLNLQNLLPSGFTGTLTVKGGSGSNCTINISQGIVTGSSCT